VPKKETKWRKEGGGVVSESNRYPIPTAIDRPLGIPTLHGLQGQGQFGPFAWQTCEGKKIEKIKEI
jgi:hypothetical protein